MVPDRPLWIPSEFPAEPEKKLPPRTDVVVVGGGIVGLSVAYWLGRSRVEHLLLDARTIGGGASGKTAGMLSDGGPVYFNRLVSWLGEESAHAFWVFTRENNRLLKSLLEDELLCAYHRHGSLTLASNQREEKEVRDSVRLLHKFGHPSTFVSKEEVERLLGVPSFFGGRLNEEDGAFHPTELLEGLRALCEEQGTALYPSTRVSSIRRSAFQEAEVTTSRGGIKATRVVLASNWAASSLRPFFSERVIPFREQMLATAPTTRRFTRCFRAHYGYEYWQQTPEGQVLLGGFRWKEPDAAAGIVEESTTEAVQAALGRFLARLCPDLDEAYVTHRWAGIVASTIDGLPIIGEIPGDDCLLTACGFGGQGYSFAFLAGKVLAERIVQGQSEVSAPLFSPRRFT